MQQVTGLVSRSWRAMLGYGDAEEMQSSEFQA